MLFTDIHRVYYCNTFAAKKKEGQKINLYFLEFLWKTGKPVAANTVRGYNIHAKKVKKAHKNDIMEYIL